MNGRWRGLVGRVVRKVVGARIPGEARGPRRPPESREQWQQGPASPDESPPLDLEDAEVGWQQVQEWQQNGVAVCVVDVRQPHEWWGGVPAGALLLPMSNHRDWMGRLPRDRPVVFVCAAGMRSLDAAAGLRLSGHSRAYSIPDGFGGWVDAGGPWVHPPTTAPWSARMRVRWSGPAADAPSCETGEVHGFHAGKLDVWLDDGQHLTGVPADDWSPNDPARPSTTTAS